ncbi:MAG: hypothetical protein A2Y40_06165 [Candidatus Margulisbacteria bacterium GWF2_35_9]|nr:MAG: hypothetical protein A2Y40_06165 [Candidatus Margulisbacteria bacterium GWF2_35_9]
MGKVILLVLLGKRTNLAIDFQKILTEYGCNIKTRLGLHEASDNMCSETGLVILELIGDKKKHNELLEKLNNHDNISAKLVEMTL